MSGLSNEFLSALWELDSGQEVLCNHLNKLLFAEALPTDLHQAYVALLPKVRLVRRCKDFRPINLLEPLNKLFCWLLIHRLQAQWVQPPCQLGG